MYPCVHHVVDCRNVQQGHKIGISLKITYYIFLGPTGWFRIDISQFFYLANNL